jgi:hypothetical protein
VKGLGFQTGDFKILSFDLRDTLLPIFNKKKKDGDLNLCRI